MMTEISRRNLGRIVFSLSLIYTILFVSLASASSPPSESPAAKAELICHTENPAECYPKVFSATDEFQIVHDDQDLPPGLHVQLDVQTGQKQAKLYDPTEEENPALAGLPVNHDVLIVDHELPPDAPKIPAGAPVYDPVGVVKAPREKDGEFTKALQILKTGVENQSSDETASLDNSLRILEDLSHDMYYGLQIAEDIEAVQSLFCLLLGQAETKQEEVRPFTERVDFMASSILSSTMRNNAPAIAAIDKSWGTISSAACHSVDTRSKLWKQLMPLSTPGSKQELGELDNIRLSLPVLSGLLKAPTFRDEFLRSEMKTFLTILLREGDIWEAKQAKVAQIITDTFLDEDMGATLGLWPKKPQEHTVDACGNDAYDECWEYHLERISRNAESDSWSHDLLSRLRQVTGSSSTPPREAPVEVEHTEL